MNFLDLPAGLRSLRLTVDEESGACLVSSRTVQEQAFGGEEFATIKERLLEALSARDSLQACGHLDGVAVAFVGMLAGHTTI